MTDCWTFTREDVVQRGDLADGNYIVITTCDGKRYYAGSLVDESIDPPDQYTNITR